MEWLAFSCSPHERQELPLGDHFEERREGGKAYGETATRMAAGLGCAREDEPEFWMGIKQWHIYFSVDDGLVVGVAVTVFWPSL